MVFLSVKRERASTAAEAGQRVRRKERHPPETCGEHAVSHQQAGNGENTKSKF